MFTDNKSHQTLIFILLSLMLIVSGCATAPSMVAAQKNIEEGRMVSSAAVTTPDFINQYTHYPSDNGYRGLKVRIDTDRVNIPTEGGSLLTQLGLVAEQPIIEATDIHFLVYAPDIANEKISVSIGQLLQSTEQYIKTMPGNSSLTVDWAILPKAMTYNSNALKVHSEQRNLEKFVKQFILHDFNPEKKHHVILVSSQDAKVSKREKQNIIDIARIFKVKSISMSALSIGDKPDFAFYNKLSQEGGGLYTPVTKDFNFNDWIAEEVTHANVKVIKDVEITAKFNYPISKILAPSNIRYRNNTIKINLPEIKQGEQKVILLDVNMPENDIAQNVRLLNVQIAYFDAEKDRYIRFNKNHIVNYVTDINDALPNKNKVINRSLAILDTQKTIEDVELQVRLKRYYQGVAYLTKQSQKLRALGNQTKDKQLLQDAKILDLYAKNLLNFNEKRFQSFKIWKDLTSDRKRFNYQYQ